MILIVSTLATASALILLIVSTIATVTALMTLTIIVAASRHKKSASGALKLIGSRGVVNTIVHPEGTVIVDGELWRASSMHALTPQTKIRVVGVQAHLLLVEPATES